MPNNRLLNNPKTIFISILIVGSLLLLYSLKMSKFTDTNKYQELNDDYYEGNITEKTYYKDIAKITTNKVILMNLGSGIVTFSLFALLFLFMSKIKTWKELVSTNTKQKSFVFVFSNIAWSLMIPGTYLYYLYRGSRGDYPPFADSISIPIMQQTLFNLLFFIPLNLFLLLSLIKSKLPTKLFLQPGKYKKAHILWEIFFACILLLNLICLVLFIIDGDHISIIVSMSFLYIVLSLRAGKLNYYS